MKKLLIVPALIIAMLFGQMANATVEYTLAFSDVDQDTSYMTAIAWMQSNGVIQGYPDGTFKPDQCVNRAEFLKMMFLTLETNIIIEDGFAGSNYYDNFFSDTSTDQWYWPYVEQALRNQTVEGYPDGTFQPGRCVNRAEAVKMGILAFDMLSEESLTRGDNVYRDVLGDNWFNVYIYSGIDAHAIGTDHVTSVAAYSMPEVYFHPGEDMSRKEVAEMLYRMKTLTDNEVFGYVETMSPEALNYYISPSSGVSFLMPDGWWVIHDDFYATASDVVADYPTILINGPTEAGEETVAINQRQMDCGVHEFAATCFDIAEGYKIGVYDPSLEALEMINRIILTFREPSSTQGYNTYANVDYNLSFNYPLGWNLTKEEVYDIGNNTQLRLMLEKDGNPDVSMWIATPPVETGYEGMTIEDGFPRSIDGLTANSEILMRNEGGDRLMARNDYYITDSDWISHIEFFLSSPSDIFDGYLPDYYMVLDSVQFSNRGEVAFDGCGAIGDYSQENWFTGLVGTWDQAILDEEIIGIPVLHDPFDSVFGEGCLALDDSLFIFIPAYLIDGSGKVFSYDTVSGVLTQAESADSYASDTFGPRVGNYVTVYGIDDYYGCEYTEGNYYYLEDRFEKGDDSCTN